LQLEWVINQYFEIDHYQPLYFIVESFTHLFEQVDLIEQWLLDGKLDNVSLGEPLVSDVDVDSFIHAPADD
jgi:phenylalanine-4-hydroxylase